MENYLQGRKMKTLVRDDLSEWNEVAREVLEGSVLAPIMLLIHANDMSDERCFYIGLSADDAKLMSEKLGGLRRVANKTRKDLRMEMKIGNG